VAAAQAEVAFDVGEGFLIGQPLQMDGQGEGVAGVDLVVCEEANLLQDCVVEPDLRPSMLSSTLFA
jgi:hypothetical protein